MTTNQVYSYVVNGCTYFAQNYPPQQNEKDQKIQKVSANIVQKPAKLSYSKAATTNIQKDNDGKVFFKGKQNQNLPLQTAKTQTLLTKRSKGYFEDKSLNQGRVLPFNSKKIEDITHKNGIFGSYCLEDVKCIAAFVLNSKPESKLEYDCFNYETIEEILFNEESIKNPDHIRQLELYKENAIKLQEMQNDGKMTFTIHYSDKHNDLLQQKEETINPSEDWDKFRRRFSENMVFFNPYLKNIKMTGTLINEFFKYAKTNLEPDGVVSIMWDPNRYDNLKYLDVPAIAKFSNFKLIKKASGAEFAFRTGFTHVKNSTSLDRSLSSSLPNLRDSDVVKIHRSDTIFMFKKETSSNTISADNKIATAFSQLRNI